MIRGAKEAADHGDVDSVDWERVARTALYRRKRAGALADLDRALPGLTDLGFAGPASQSLVMRQATSTVFLSFLVTVRRSCATWAAPSNSIQAGAGHCPPPADTPGTSTAVTTPQATASMHDFAVSLSR